MHNIQLLITFIVLMVSFSAQSQAIEIRPVVSIGYDVGGDTLLDYTVISLNGRPISIKDKITAGHGLTLAAGLYVPMMDNIGIQATAGLKIDSATFVDTYLAFSRNPIDVLAIGSFGHHNFSGGVTFHTGVDFTCTTTDTTLTGCNSVTKFDNAWGAIAEYTYAIPENYEGGLKIGLRLTKINYTLSGSTSNFDGSSVGLILYGY